jgi:hypothetical protein
MVFTVAALIGKMDRANEGLDSMQEAFEQLSRRVGADYMGKWEEEERKAFEIDGIGPKIYKAETAKGKVFST